jgi:4-carboxymuconolactone decarboxylase
MRGPAVKSGISFGTVQRGDADMGLVKSVGAICLAFMFGMSFSGTSYAQNQASGADRAAASLPKDVYPESRNRLPLPRREDVDDAGKKVFDEMTVKSQHPLPRLFDPLLAKPMSQSAYYLKFQTGLPSRLLEIAVLVTARELDCQFEWTQWEQDARNVDDPRHIEQSTVDIIKYSKPLTGLGEKETAIIALGREMLGQKKVSSKTFADVQRLMGPRFTVDLIELMVGYSACRTEMTVFDQQLMPGQTPLLPPGRTHAFTPVRSSAVPPTAGPLPKDIYPDSRNRMPLPKREDMDDFGKAVFDEVSPKLGMPFEVPQRLYDPKLAKPLYEAHHFVRYETGLPERLIEIAVLVTARERDSQYEWTQWETYGRDPKDPRHIEPAIIDIIKYDKPVVGLGEKETAIIKLGRGMFEDEHVSSETFADVVRLFGRRGTVDLVELMTLYSADAAEMAAFDQQLPEGQKPLMPVR